MPKYSVIVQIGIAGGLMAILFLPLLVSGTAPDISIVLHNPERIDFDISPETDNVLIRNGSIELKPVEGMIRSHTFLISLSADTGGWDWDIVPSSLLIRSGDRNRSFTVRITVPLDQPANKTEKIRIFGEATSLPGLATIRLRSVSLSVNVRPFIDTELFTSDVDYDVKAGEIVKLEVGMRNNGNVPIQANFCIRKRDEFIREKGWFLDFQRTRTFPIGVDKEEKIVILVSPRLPEDKARAIFTINISAEIRALTRDGRAEGEKVNSYALKLRVHRELPESAWSLDPYDPTSEINLEEREKLPILRDLNLKEVGKENVSVYLLVIGGLVFLLYFFRYRK